MNLPSLTLLRAEGLFRERLVGALLRQRRRARRAGHDPDRDHGRGGDHRPADGHGGRRGLQRFQKAKLTNAKQISRQRQAGPRATTPWTTNEDCPPELKELHTRSTHKGRKDPWGEELIYKCPGEHDTESADVSSKGPDKQEGTEDDITLLG